MHSPSIHPPLLIQPPSSPNPFNTHSPMEFSHTLVIFSTIFFTIILTLIRPKRRLNLPPGPPGWPIVGNLLQVAGSGKPFFQYVRELVPKYGPIITLKMGTRTMIIISRADVVHEALIENGQVFATRPAENPTRAVFSCNKFTVNAALYGPVWRSLRRNMVQNALSASKLRTFREVRGVAMDKLVDRLKAEAEANGGAVWVLKNARFAVFCILVSMCFGVEMDEKTIEQIDEMMKLVLLTLDPRLDDYLPLLRPLCSKKRKRAMEVREQQIAMLVPFIERRRAAIGSLGSDPTAAEFAYLDTLFDLTVEGRNDPPSNPEIVTLCSEFLNGGTDTTATAVEWAVARFIEAPSIQSRIYEEIKSVVGERKINEKDIENMPYLNAVVKELLRKHPPTYFSLTHSVTEPAKLAGYDIPKGANVEIYIPGISEDPKLWTNPDRFDPDRFLTGGESADITGATELKMIPFGVGRRICPGLGMATLHVSLMIGRMVQEFEWTSWPQNSKVDFSEKTEFTVVMKNTLRAMITSRV
ncbi:putative cytochrome P450 [Helianthus annuus]|uniref:Cytochrome P450 n=1 Tax=Helianthus annuus TaxID=4232 RepID=A0A251UST5_HELAN|nr:cytochrome P450 77A2 [Helianthus annuus]KAF5806043.1 putative cytochrome P450 [Helianthus annuus]KAJ0584711.1 putative cytochrome P450 [Helianthus annuus]KAJ0750379.1 putative cytochrome P450 [Helianthus annuus]KAJ0919115.1 putative cytochrome P450 [Helianthus annuus]